MELEQAIKHIQQFFPTTPTKDVARDVRLSIYQVRTLAKKHNVIKCSEYKERLKDQLIINRRKWYEDNIPEFEPTHYQEQLIYGSLLGDGYISKGTQRSINYYYQEHFGESQRGYREWKLFQLNGLNFTIHGNYLRSSSHAYFNKLRSRLYPNNTKTLDKSFLSTCTHPVFLTSLYLDDGSLVMSYKYNKRTNTVYCHPTVILYTLNFKRAENQLLANHLNVTFGTNFFVSGHPDGYKSLLKLNKESEVRHLLSIIAPYAKDIPSVEYKTDIELNIKLKKNHIHKRFGDEVNIIISSSNRMKAYTSEEIATIIKLKNDKVADHVIADEIGRSYWSTVYKITELRKKSLL